MPLDMEKYRLQLFRNCAIVELWLENDAWNDHEPDEDEVREQVLKKYGETLEQIDEQLKTIVTPFMGNVPAVAIPLDYEGKPLMKSQISLFNNLAEG